MGQVQHLDAIPVCAKDNRAEVGSEFGFRGGTERIERNDPFQRQRAPTCAGRYSQGGVALTAGVHAQSEPPTAVLAVDDRDDRIESMDGLAWKEWLRLRIGLGSATGIESPLSHCSLLHPLPASKFQMSLRCSLIGRHFSTTRSLIPNEN